MNRIISWGGLMVALAGLVCPLAASAQGSGMVLIPATRTVVSALPGAPSNTSKTYIVTDAVDASDCSTGGSSNLAHCAWDGSAWQALGGGGGLSDGDKGDVVVSGSGAAWTVADDAITAAKIDATETIVAAGFDVTADATDGGCITLKEGADDGTSTWSLCVDNAGLLGTGVCTIGTNGIATGNCLGFDTDGSTGASTKAGFPTWTSVEGRPDLMVRAGLRSNTNDDIGYSTWASVLPSVVPTFDATNGATFTSARGLRFNIETETGLSAAFENAGFYAFSISNDVHESNPQGALTYPLTDNAANNLQLGTGGNYRDRMTPSPATGESVFNYLATDPSGFYQVASSWEGDTRSVYVDGLMVTSIDTSGAAAPDYSRLILGGDRDNTNGAGQWDHGTVRDFFMLSSPQRFNRTESVLMLGDRSTAGGCPDSKFTSGYVPTPGRDGLVLPWVPTTTGGTGTNYGCGVDASDVYAPAISTNYDHSYIPTFFRELSKKGISTTSNSVYAKFGATSADIPAQIDLVEAAGLKPTIVLLAIGTEDVAAGGDAGGFELCDGVSAATFRTNMRENVTRLYTLGVSRVVVAYIPTLSNEIGPPSYNSPECDATLASFNAEIGGLRPWAEASGMGVDFVRVADLFSPFGGDEADSALFVASDYLPNLAGSHIIGEVMANAACE